MPSLPPILVELKAEAGRFHSELGKAERHLGALGDKASGLHKFAAVGKVALEATAASAVLVGVESVKMAGDFQEAMTTLVTGAGESESNLKAVSRGVLDLSKQTGVGAEQLASGLYMIESAGYHGAAGLAVLKSATQGAAVGGANMADVANAVTSALNAYSLKGTDATMVTDTLVATVASGKMHMEDLTSALGAALPTAAALHVSLSELGGALATMTAQGIDANRAATALRFLMSNLAAPSGAAAQKLTDFGLTSEQVGDTLTHKGLNAALELITHAVGKKFPEGTAAYMGAVTKIVGGTRGMQATLALTGSHVKTFNANVANIADKAKHAGKEVDGWKLVQEDFNHKVSVGIATLKVWGIQLGTWLIPKIEATVAVIEKIVGWLEKHHTAATALAGAIIGSLVAAFALWVVAEWPVIVANLALIASMLPWIILFAAIGAAVMLLLTHWRQAWGAIKTVFIATWHAIRDAMSAAWAFIKQHIGLILTLLLGPFGLMLSTVLHHWQAIWGAISDVMRHVYAAVIAPVASAIGKALHGIGTALSWLVNNVWYPLWDGVKSAVQSAWDFIKPIIDKISGALHLVSGAVSKVSGAVGKVSGAVGKVASWTGLANATGTDDSPGGLTLVGERGPELMYVPRHASITPNNKLGSVGGGGVHVHLHGPVYGANSDELARKVRDAMLRMQGRGARLGFAT